MNGELRPVCEQRPCNVPMLLDTCDLFAGLEFEENTENASDPWANGDFCKVSNGYTWLGVDKRLEARGVDKEEELRAAFN